MEREHADRRRGVDGALANKQAADSRAHALASIIHELMASGFLSRLTLTAELNRRGIPTAQGARWHDNTVVRMLSRLGLRASLIDGRTNNGQAGKQSAEAKAEALAPTVRELQAQGFDTLGAIARELNARGIPTSRGTKWQATSVKRLLERLDRLDRLSLSHHPR
jgi:Recombinase